MRNTGRTSLRARLLAGVAALSLLHPMESWADPVGTAGAANIRSSGTPPGGASRVIEIGAKLVQNEKIETSASGSVQVLFIDKTTLDIGPNSTLVIDKYVFDAEAGKGELAVSLGKGVLRVVGGAATHSGGATIKTQVSTIGIRGGILMAKHSAAEGTEAILGFGVLTVTSGGVTRTVSQPGFWVRSFDATLPPSAPTRASLSQIALWNAGLSSRPGQAGGSSVSPTEEQADEHNIGLDELSTTTYDLIRDAEDEARRLAMQGIQIAATTGLVPLTSPPPPPPHLKFLSRMPPLP